MMQNLLIQLCLVALAMAAPVADESMRATAAGNAWQYGTGGGLLGLIVLILDVIVFVEVIKSSRPPSHKLLWSLLVFIFPIGGLIIYWLFSDRAAHNTSSGYETLP